MNLLMTYCTANRSLRVPPTGSRIFSMVFPPDPYCEEDELATPDAAISTGEPGCRGRTSSEVPVAGSRGGVANRPRSTTLRAGQPSARWSPSNRPWSLRWPPRRTRPRPAPLPGRARWASVFRTSPAQGRIGQARRTARVPMRSRGGATCAGGAWNRLYRSDRKLMEMTSSTITKRRKIFVLAPSMSA